MSPLTLGLDIETRRQENIARETLLRLIDKRIKDPAKINAAIAKIKLATKPQTGHVMCIAAQFERDRGQNPWVCYGPDEHTLLTAFFAWFRSETEAPGQPVRPDFLAFNASFDLGFIRMRSWRLGIPLPADWPSQRDIVARSRRIIDPQYEFTGDRYSYVSAAEVGEWLGIEIPEDEVTGAGMQALYDAGNWGGIERHNVSDLRRLWLMADAMGL